MVKVRRIRAITIEYVHAVLKARAALDAIASLIDIDETSERYKRYMPANFGIGYDQQLSFL